MMQPDLPTSVTIPKLRMAIHKTDMRKLRMKYFLGRKAKSIKLQVM